MKVTMVLHPRINIDSNIFSGLARVVFYELEHFNKEKVEAKLYGNIHPPIWNVKKALHVDFLGKRDPLYYAWLLSTNYDSDIFIGAGVPELGLLLPSKSILHFHSFQWTDSLPYYNLFKKNYEKAHYVFCSDYIKNEFIKKYELPRDHCFTIYNGVDTTRFYPIKQIKNVRDVNIKKIMFAGQWAKEKGIYTLLKAAKILNERREDFEILLVGSPFIWPSKKMLKKNKLNEKIIDQIISSLENIKKIGIIDHNKMPDILNKADIFVFPSVCQEGLPLVLLEAMACGLPCIATRVGGVPEIIESDELGILIEPNNPEELARAIECLLDNEDERKRIGKAARKAIIKNFTWHKHINEYIRVIEGIIEKKL